MNRDDIPSQEDIARWNHLEGVKIPKLPSDYYQIEDVTVMIGTNIPTASAPLEVVLGDEGEPYALRSQLGWVIYGLPGKPNQQEVQVNFCKINNVTSVQDSNERLGEQLKNYMNMEFVERLSDSTLLPSVEDRKFLQLMDERVEVKSGHYVVPLPFRKQPLDMPNNYTQATAYANYLKRKLKNNQQLHDEYSDFMTNLEEKGYSERVPPEELQREDGRVWYIPHHAVRHPRKQSIRVVFNCPAKYGGTSLNSELLQGPDMTNRLYGILLRWRKEEIAVMADVEAMFHQVNVPSDDRDMLRYIWWPQGDLQRDPEVYRMKVHIFGAISSPSCANYALRRCATDHSSQYEETVCQTVLNDFYVDDLLKSMENEEEAVKLVRDLREMLAEGGFSLKKWVSNSREVIDSVPSTERAKTLKSLDIYQEELPTERSLGVLWDVEEDKIGFSVKKEEDDVPTRRKILSIMSSVYDPIGFTAPFVLNAKKILQVCSKQKIDWDQTIPVEQQKEWYEWLRNLPKLENVKIDRCYKPSNFGKVIDTQMHHFSDASQDGYGTVSYLRITNEMGETHCAFVSGKARVAPIKPHSIVKMELQAATSAVRQDTLLKKELKMNIDNTTFWTDSQTVLKYISNQKTRLPVFVANRIAVIHDGSNVEQWRYIPTSLNPADHASRGLSVDQLVSKTEWLQGPKFLYKQESEWPSTVTNEESKDESEEAREENNTVTPTIIVQASKVTNSETEMCTGEASKPEDAIKRLIHYYSDWTRLRRAVAWLMKLKKTLLYKCTDKGSNPKEESMFLTVDEINEAEAAIVMYVQRQNFLEEIRILEKAENHSNNDENSEISCDNNLTNGDKTKRSKHGKQKQLKKISKTSNLTHLDPILNHGILKVGGRLERANIPEDAKHQWILPNNHHVTSLIIRYIHRICHHQGKNYVMSELRQKYWIVKGGVTVKSIIKQCTVCRKNHARPATQKMAPLPASRVKAHEPPFAYTGIDFFGSYQIKQGRSIKKRYGVIFTCMNSRAVHLESAECMDTSSCVNALRRFVCRRGHVKEITSDNGTNLCGADRELRQAVQELDPEVLHTWAANKGIKWKYNPPAASHHGGVWERIIRSVRQILQSTLQEQHVKVARSEEQLQTLLCEVENILNSRPLTKVCDDPNDLDVITPNQLLQPRIQEHYPPGKFTEQDKYARQRWRQVQFLADLFWKRWVREYLPTLQRRQKWLHPERNYAVGDIVLIADQHAPRNSWLLGKIISIHEDNQGYVRSAKIKTKTATLTRPITKLCLLLENDA